MGYLRRWTRADVRRVAARSRPRLRFLVAAVAAVGMLAIAAHSDVLGPVSHSVQPAHAVASSLGGEFAIPVGHPHVDNGPSDAHHEAFPAAMLTKSSLTNLVALGLVAALVIIAGSLAAGVVPVGRGPPGGPAGARTGQELLTRLCLSRR